MVYEIQLVLPLRFWPNVGEISVYEGSLLKMVTKNNVVEYDVNTGRRNLCTTTLCVLFVLMENCFYLVDTGAINIAGVFNFDLVWQVLFVLFMVYALYVTQGVRSRFVTLGNAPILIMLACIFISAHMCQIITGQPFARGLIPQRSYLLMTVAFCVLYRLYAAGLIDVERVFSFIIIAGAIGTCIYTLQVVVGGSFQFIHVNVNERYGASRIYVDSMLCVMSGLISFWRLLKTMKVKYVLPVVLLFVYELCVSKGRLEFAAILVALCVGFMFARRSVDLKSLILPVLFGAVIVFFASDYGNEILQNYMSADTDVSFLVRESAKEYYASQMSQSPLTMVFGCGYPSELYPVAYDRAGVGFGYFLVDNGMNAFAYVYGIVGFLAVVLVWLRMLIVSFRSAWLGGSCVYLMYACLNIILSYNIIFWWWQGAWMLLFPLMYCAILNEQPGAANKNQLVKHSTC